MRGTDSVATHVLHRLNLSDEGGLVDSSTQGAQVVVQADTLQFARLSVQLEATFP